MPLLLLVYRFGPRIPSSNALKKLKFLKSNKSLKRLLAGSYYANPVDKEHIESMNKQLETSLTVFGPVSNKFGTTHNRYLYRLLIQDRWLRIRSFQVDQNRKGGCTVSWNKYGGPEAAPNPQSIENILF